MSTPSAVIIPYDLYQRLESVLSERQFITTEDDQDNDYEVIELLEKLRACAESNGLSRS